MAQRTIGPASWTAPGTSLTTLLTQFTGSEGTQVYSAPTVHNPYSVQKVETVNLASGFNSIAVPTSAGGVIVVLPEGNTQSCTLKGITGDTGVGINPVGFAAVCFPASPPSTIGLTAGATINGVRLFWF